MTTTRAAEARTSGSRNTRWSFAALYGVVGSVLVALVVLAFVWPAAAMQVRDLPVGISGPDDAVAAFEQALAEQDPSPFFLQTVASPSEAESRIRDHELYGAIVLGDDPQVMIATAASPVAAQALRGVATQIQAQISAGVQQALGQQLTAISTALASGQVPPLPSGAKPPTVPEVTVTDLVPLASGDRTGAGLAAVVFPLVLGGLLGGILLSLLVQGVIRRLAGLVVFGAAAGAAIMLVMQTWFSLVPGNWLLNAAVAGLGVTATAALVIGFTSLMGPSGIGVGAVITMLIANPMAGAAAPVQFLPQPWGDVGQWFVPGASATLLRLAAYFPDATTVVPWLTLAAWTAVGVVLALIGHHRQRAEVPLPEGQLEPAHSASGPIHPTGVEHGLTDEHEPVPALRRRATTSRRGTHARIL